MLNTIDVRFEFRRVRCGLPTTRTQLGHNRLIQPSGSVPAAEGTPIPLAVRVSKESQDRALRILPSVVGWLGRRVSVLTESVSSS
jgi:hypothetical protein